MGYFDALTSASFKVASDGRKLFYPWGFLGRGYLVPNDDEFDQLRRSYKTIWVVIFILVFATVVLFEVPLLPLAAWVFYLIWLLIWIRTKTRGLSPVKEKLTYGEALSSETSKLSSGFLWFFEILSLVFIVYGVILLIVEPSQRLISIGIIALFTFTAIIYARMIRKKRQQTRAIK
jgi:hypothetical protein